MAVILIDLLLAQLLFAAGALIAILLLVAIFLPAVEQGEVDTRL